MAQGATLNGRNLFKVIFDETSFRVVSLQSVGCAVEQETHRKDAENAKFSSVFFAPFAA